MIRLVLRFGAGIGIPLLYCTATPQLFGGGGMLDIQGSSMEELLMKIIY